MRNLLIEDDAQAASHVSESLGPEGSTVEVAADGQAGLLDAAAGAYDIARRRGRKIHLKPRGYEVLEYLLRHRRQVVARTMLLEDVRQSHFAPQRALVEVHITRPFGKIDQGVFLPLIHTYCGAGYKLDVA